MDRKVLTRDWAANQLERFEVLKEELIFSYSWRNCYESVLTEEQNRDKLRETTGSNNNKNNEKRRK